MDALNLLETQWKYLLSMLPAKVDLEASAREMLARALFAQGKLAEAQKEIETAGKLSPQDRTIRLSIAITAAKLNARAGKITEARHALEAAFAEASRRAAEEFRRALDEELKKRQ